MGVGPACERVQGSQGEDVCHLLWRRRGSEAGTRLGCQTDLVGYWVRSLKGDEEKCGWREGGEVEEEGGREERKVGG